MRPAERVTAGTSPRAPVRVLIVDDHPLIRRGLSEMVRHEPGVEVCGEAADAPATWREIERGRPELMILDLSLRDSDGLELLKNVRARYPAIRVLVVSMHDEKVYAERALRAGASGYVQKQEPPETVVQAMRDVLAGRVYVSPAMAERLLHRLVHGGPAPQPSSLESLSDRELEVLSLLGEGLTTQQIAEQLHLSKKTVQSHRERLKLKLQLGNASELVRFAVTNRLERS
ncbi:MAG: response regulator transcription factor [Gemmatimonadetes bacterium]|nr:response regulator transcription factor [Gemmatimonadota bacterium]